jgi:NADH-quinone oxidoreductase subunit G
VALHLVTPGPTRLDRDAASVRRATLADLPAAFADAAAGLPSSAVVIVNARGGNDAIASLLAAPEGGSAPQYARLLFLDSGTNPAGAILMGLAPGWLPGPVRSDAASRAAFHSLWGAPPPEPLDGASGEAPSAGGAPALLGRVKEGEGLLLVNGLVPHTWSDPEAILRAARAASFVALWDFRPSALSTQADVLFPARSYVETAGTTFTPDLRIQRLVEAVRAPEGVPSLASTLAAVSRRLGTLLETSPGALFREMRAAVPALAGLTPASVGRRGARLDLGRLGELPSREAGAVSSPGTGRAGASPGARLGVVGAGIEGREE